jgi:hypothetical protein
LATPSLLPVSALERRIGVPENSLSGVDLARAQCALEDASALVRSESRKSWLNDTNEVQAPDEVLVVTLRAAIREYKNPDGFSSEQLGEYSYRRENSSGVYLTTEEVAIIRRAAFGANRLTTIRTPSAYYAGDETSGITDDAFEGSW